MRKFLSIIVCLFVLCATVPAVTVNDVAGSFTGTLKIGDTNYPDKEIYILPGVTANTVTFVLPDFSFGEASLGDIVLVNIPMATNGQLTLEDAPLYIRALETHVSVSMNSGSKLAATQAQVTLAIAVEGMPEPIAVSFSGAPSTKNYDFVNGGFEGTWSSNEPSGWHSFGSATGSMASFVSGNTDQFSRATDKRPGSAGSQSALIKSKSIFGVRANGNCTNGRINAGSMTASDGSSNYNVSNPSASGYNTPFAGQPDSLVFWAKYIPADGNPSNSSNKARAHAVITTNAKYQDPEAGNNYSSVKIADAEINYSATSTKGWQRISVPFKYYSVDPSQAAYMLMTFTTNANPGGGTTSGSSVDNIYLDDAEMIYNYGLTSLTMNGAAVAFNNGNASSEAQFSDSEYLFNAKTNGKGSKSFIGYDTENYRVYVYVVAGNYSQAKRYSVYSLQMAEPDIKPGDTQYAYTATICDNETYTDELFENLSSEGVYTKTLPNAAGADSVVTLTLSVLPTYLFTEEASTASQTYEWRGKQFTNLEYTTEPQLFYDSLLTTQGCDSVYCLALYVTTIPRTYGNYAARVCEGDSVEFNGVYYKEAFAGDILISKKNHYGGDSVVHLTVEIAPNYRIEEYMTIRQGEEKQWESFDLSTQAPGMLTLKTKLLSKDDCDSIRILHLTVLSTTRPWQGSDIVAAREICGKYEGELVIDGAIYADKEVFVLPGTVDSTVTFVLPDFSYNGGRLGHVVLPNIEITKYGQLLLEDRPLYMDTISERATVTMINGLREGTETYYSLLSPDKAQVVLYIEAPSLPQGILVFFRGVADRDKNYDVVNGGFEGTWTNSEPAGWHSFGSATGAMVKFVQQNGFQFVPSADVRPWSKGSQSALISSSMILGVAANGNCTNGQINAGTTNAAEASKNFNFSDPENEGFNTPFHGRPDSIVFWAKYQPADRNASNEVNRARMSTIITTDARYQDPEEGDYYADVKIAKAELNYAATSDMGWQRLAAPFTYYEAAAENRPAYLLTTFTTNMVPGGGSSYTMTESPHNNVLDSVYLDDVQMVYNKSLTRLVRNEDALEYRDGAFRVEENYCDSCDLYSTATNSRSAKTFLAFDEAHKCLFVYVIADDYSQSLTYSLYRVEFTDSDTEGLIEAVENVAINEAQFEKVLYHGELYIRRGEVWFNASGARVK